MDTRSTFRSRAGILRGGPKEDAADGRHQRHPRVGRADASPSQRAVRDRRDPRDPTRAGGRRDQATRVEGQRAWPAPGLMAEEAWGADLAAVERYVVSLSVRAKLLRPRTRKSPKRSSRS